MTEPIMEPPFSLPSIVHPQQVLGPGSFRKSSNFVKGSAGWKLDGDGSVNIYGLEASLLIADTSDTSCFVALFEAATGNLVPKTDAGLTYNAGTGVLTATGFSGPLTGNVTGNVSGTALTVTQAAQSAITSLGTLTSATITGDLIVDTSTLKVDSSNDRVGIGTASPGSKLEVYHNAASEHVAVFDQDHATGEGVKITGDMAGAQAMLLIESVDSVTTPNAPEIFRINANGMIGMGTASPADKIHMVTTTGDCLLRTYNQVSGLLVGSSSPGAIVQTTGAVPLSLGTAGVDRMTITSAGVGIGIGTPAYKLDVDGDINYTGGSSIYYDTADAANSVAFRIDAGNRDVSIFRVSTDTWSTSGDYGATLKYMGTRTGNNNSLSIFMDNQTGTQVEAMTILQDGSVGIGTDSVLPFQFNVLGTPWTRDSTWTAGDLAIWALGSSVGATERFGVGYKHSTGMIMSVYKASGGGSFGSNSYDAMTILDGGNVGIGTAVPSGVLDLGNGLGRKFYLYHGAGAVTAGLGIDVSGAGYEWSAWMSDAVAAAFHFGRHSGSAFTSLAKIDYYGAAYNLTGTWGTLSQLDLKQDITDASSQIEDIKAMRFVNYRFKADVVKDGEDAPVLLGVIAEELEAAGMGGLVSETKWNSHGEESRTVKAAKMSIISVKAVKALQELIARVEALEDV